MTTPTLHPHQKEALEKLSNGNILAGGVGSGKSMTAVAYYLEKEYPRDVYVVTTAKKRDSRDWEREFANFAIYPKSMAEADPGGHPRAKLTVTSWNQLEKYDGVEGAFFIFDEQRAVGKGKWAKTFVDVARRNRWILLSATPGDIWLDYVPVFLANGFYKNRTEFISEHVIYNHHAKFPKVDRYVGVGRLVRLRNQILVDMPFDRHTVRHQKIVKVDHDQELFERVWKQRWHVYENRPLRDVAELFSVARKVVNSDSSRLRVIQDLLSTHPRLIVFYNFDYELEMLRSLLENSPTEHISTRKSQGSGSTEQISAKRASRPRKESEWKSIESNGTSTITSRCTPETTSKLDGSMNAPTSDTSKGGSYSQPGSTIASYAERSPRINLAEWNGHKHEPIPKSRRWVYLVQYVAGAEGWNCIETDTIVFFSLTYSYKNFEQAKGRIDRLNTPWTNLYYYVLRSDSPMDSAVWKALMAKKSFNEASFARSHGLSAKN